MSRHGGVRVLRTDRNMGNQYLRKWAGTGDYDSFATADAFERAVAFLDEYVKGKSN